MPARFERHELIFYRLASILNATLVKAACFTVLMLPDLRHPIAGFVGALLALICLDLLRSTSRSPRTGWSAELPAVSLRHRAISAAVVVSSLVIAFSTPHHGRRHRHT